jgi:hypothetical protein
MTSHRWKLILFLAGAVAVALLIIAIFVSFNRGDQYQAFRNRCLAGAGNSLVTLTTTVRVVTMGAPETGYKMGCRQKNGTIIATIETNHQ